MSYSPVICEIRDYIAYISLNSPSTDNALNEPLAQNLEAVCQRVNQAEDIRVVVLSGSGDRAFCSGDDPGPSLKYKVSTIVASIKYPVIAAINGDALGQGLELALSCDIRIASEKAKFGLPYITLGLIPMDGGTQRLPRIVGKAKALEMILTGNIIDAYEACRIGLVSKVLPQHDLVPEVEELARNIASKGPIATRYTKEAVNKGLDLTLAEGLELEAQLASRLEVMRD